MIDIQHWLKQFTDELEKTFRERIWFVGLQGSYGRGEATEQSDIDVVVILDTLVAEDIKAYETMLSKLLYRDLICGFVSGKDELMNWDTADLFQFYYDTTPIIGTLDDLLPLIDSDAVRRAIKIGAGNLYHGCVHNMLHERSEDILKGLYKSAVFTVQAVYFLQSGTYIKQKSELIQLVKPAEAQILMNAEKIRSGISVDFEETSQTLFTWANSLLLLNAKGNL